jgi:NADH-quinone oxidoreductase subunit I
MGYWKDLWLHTKTIAKGMGITARYLVRPTEITTVQYPHEMDDIPVRHRGIHYLETDVCILCYQCSRACPVDCIEIEGTRVPNDGFEGAYKGAKGAWITKFTVDYARCIFCHLCIEPCPVDCIHMGKEFDYSGYTRAEMVKNLLTDKIFSKADQALLNKARKTVLELEEKDKREKEEKKKAAAAAAKAAAAKAPAAGAAASSAPAPGAKPESSASAEARPSPEKDAGKDGGKPAPSKAEGPEGKA